MCLLVLLAAVAPASASAATITVGGACSLNDAVLSANGDTATGGCTAGSGPDTIALAATTYTGFTPATITSTVTIQGISARTTIVDAQHASAILSVDPGGQLDLRDVTLTNGVAAAGVSSVIGTPGGDGGAIANRGTATITRSIFTADTAGLGGTSSSPTVPGGNGGRGGAIASSGTLIVTASLFTGNEGGTGAPPGASAPGQGGIGGAIAVTSGSATLLNDTFTGNLAGTTGASNARSDGDAIATDGGATAIARQLTISESDTEASLLAASGTITLTSSIVTGSSGACIGVTDGGLNRSPSPGCATTTSSPALSPLGNHGGPTDTMLPSTVGSGVDTVAVGAACEGTDQRGLTRPFGTACDAGAVELRDPAFTGPASVDLGSAPISAVGAPHVITFTVPAISELAGEPCCVRISGAAADDVLVSNDVCSGATLAAAQSCSVTLHLLPSAVGVRSASLALVTVPGTAPAPPVVAVTGTGLAASTGPKGDNGAPGAPGVAGSAGALGPTGPKGATGAAGRNATVTCKVAKPTRAKTVKVTCTVRNAPRAVTARLERGGATLARDTLDRRGVVRFTVSAHAAHRARRLVLRSRAGAPLLSLAIRLP